jgi:egghead protein (zeste-white 4 protein)
LVPSTLISSCTETRFDAETVRGVLAHCVAEDEAIARGAKIYGNIGQGVILYGTQEPDNWLTTLADSVRVGDDFGKFRIQYELHEPLIGMHGSFVVSQNAVEKLVTFDHGMEGSITEDAYFALVAQVKGIKFSWIDSFMYEQSPFSCIDFMHQRCRWFAGLWLIVLSRRIPFLNRAVLLFFMATWAATPLIWLAMTLCMCVASSVPYWFRACIGLISGMSTWGYILGFAFTFKARDGSARLLLLFGLQLLLQPLFAAMELSGVVLGIVAPPTQGFHIVQKEGTKVQKSTGAMSRNSSLASIGKLNSVDHV